jgi:hypothetical protein
MFNNGNPGMRLRMLLPLAIVVLSSAGALAQESHDGTWWTGLSGGSKLGVITGFLDGMALGHNLSLMGAGNSTDPGCRMTIAQSYTSVRIRFFQNVGPGDIVATLDDLYADSENSSIIVGRAVWIAVNRLAGSSDEDVQKLILQSRGVNY